MSGKLGIPSAKDSRALLEGAASSSQKKGKRKRLTLLNTRVTDDPKGYKLSKAEVAATQAGTTLATTSIEPSLAKSTKKAKSKSHEGEETMIVSLLVDGSAYSDPSFMKDVTEALLLSSDRKRLNEIGPV